MPALPKMRKPQGRRTELRKALVLIALALAIAACEPTGPTGPTAATMSPPPPAPTTAGALAGVTVPGAFTPLTVQPISQPTFPFPGTDGKFHLAFNVQITNATAVAATLDGVSVVSGQDPTKVLGSF